MNKSLRKFAVTYVSLLIFVLLLLIPMYIRTYGLFQSRELEISRALLENGISKLDNEINSLTALVQGTYSDNRYRILTNSYRSIQLSDYFSIMQIQKDFQRIVAPQTLISDCGIIYNSGIVLTRFRSFTEGGFYGPYFSVEGYDYHQWLRLITGNSSRTMLPSQLVTSYDYGQYDSLLWVSPVSETASANHQGYFYGVIHVEHLLHLLIPENVQKNGFLRIQDVTGAELLNYRYGGSTDGYVTYSGSMKTTGISFLVGIPNTSFSQQLAPLRNMLLIYFLAVLLIGITLSLFFAYRSSLPIRQLITLLRDTHQSGTASIIARESDFDFIKKVFSEMNRTLEEFGTLIQSQKAAIKCNVFEKRLLGTSIQGTDDDLDFEKFFPDFPQKFLLALVRFSEHADESSDMLASRQIIVKKLIENTFPKEVYAQPAGSSFIVILLPSTEGNTPADSRWHDMLCALKQARALERGFSLRISLSDEFCGYHQLSEAFSQVQHILQLSGDDDDVCVWRATNFSDRQTHLPIDFSRMQQLYGALSAGRKEAVHSIFSLAYDRIRDMGPADELFCRQTFYNLRGVLLSIKLERFDILNSVEIPAYGRDYDFFMQIADLQSCCDTVCDAIAGAPQKNKSFAVSVLEFIDGNLTNKELYTRTVTQQFGIGATTLQKILHNTTGKSFLEYVEEHRIEKAYELLTTTAESVTDIAEQCGFSSYNTMYKAFRRKYKVSPGSVKRAEIMVK